ncbi:MAG: radical SAM family heme chaperone HemW [Clostridiales bacterium]|nr:radical SAM family heme chaperone HemW [Clostridiales bacterium]
MSGIYIHVPFCAQKCTYCDFASYPKEINKAESYFACLYRELEGRAKATKDKVFDTVYIGGGTPSVVDSKFIVGAVRQVKKQFNLAPNAEITIELNPGTVDEKKIKDYKSVGINRFSIGLQTGFNEELKRLNRIHTAKDFLLTCNLLKGENISADILIGLWDQKLDDVKKSIDLALAGGVSHISVYALTPETGTPIYTDYLNGELLSDDEVRDIYDGVVEYLKEKGLFRYEVSNFAKLGFESKHNQNYWRRGEYVGAGVSASGFLDGRRYTNSYSIDEYMNAVIYNKMPEISSDEIVGDDAEFEFIMLGLRTREGISVKEFNDNFKVDFTEKYKETLKKKDKFLNFDGDRLTIKDEYLYVQNDIIMDFLR